MKYLTIPCPVCPTLKPPRPALPLRRLISTGNFLCDSCIETFPNRDVQDAIVAAFLTMGTGPEVYIRDDDPSHSKPLTLERLA